MRYKNKGYILGLKLTRTVGIKDLDTILIGDDITITLTSINEHHVGVAIIAPKDIKISRAELERD